MAGFKKAERVAVKHKILLTGPSGSGKTLGGLTLAHGLTNGGKVAVIDSEHERALYYADVVPFDHMVLEEMTPKAYIAAIDEAVAGGYSVAVIDSLSHCWNDVLERKEAHERSKPGSNGFMLWKIYGAEFDALLKHILTAPIHVIATSRSKQVYEQTTDDKGKKKVEKLGLAPQVRDGVEYEFGLVFDVNRMHTAEAGKDNTGLFSGVDAPMVDLCDPSVAQQLRDWASSAKPAPVVVPPTLDELRDELINLMVEELFTAEERVKAAKAATGVRVTQKMIARVKQMAEERATDNEEASRAPAED